LATLSLYWNQLSSLSLAAGLTNLTSLDLSANNGLASLTLAGGLPRLTYLNLGGSHLTNLSFLSELTNLSALSLAYDFGEGGLSSGGGRGRQSRANGEKEYGMGLHISIVLSEFLVRLEVVGSRISP
jgi:hypothetical protein